MSQQKFASNVVEKCLTFGSPIERQILVTEMLGSTDENEPLQVFQFFMCILFLETYFYFFDRQIAGNIGNHCQASVDIFLTCSKFLTHESILLGVTILGLSLNYLTLLFGTYLIDGFMLGRAFFLYTVHTMSAVQNPLLATTIMKNFVLKQ